MKDDQITSIVADETYPAVYEHLCDIVEDSPTPALAAAGLLNASAAILLALVGPDATADILRRAADEVPQATVAARNRLV